MFNRRVSSLKSTSSGFLCKEDDTLGEQIHTVGAHELPQNDIRCIYPSGRSELCLENEDSMMIRHPLKKPNGILRLQAFDALAHDPSRSPYTTSAS